MNAKPLAPALLGFSFATAALAGPAVVVEPVTARVDRNWLYDLRDARTKPGTLSEAEVNRMAADMSASLRTELDKALRAQGFDVVAGGAGAVRLVASIEELRVNAPDRQAAGVRSYSREAGRATLHAEARDAAGNVLLKTQERADAGDSGGPFQRADDVTNRFWFDAMFREWAAGVAKQLRAKSP